MTPNRHKEDGKGWRELDALDQAKILRVLWENSHPLTTDTTTIHHIINGQVADGKLIYHMVWPTSGTVADLAASMGHRLNRYITQTFVIFHWYDQASAKDHERQRRAGESSTEYQLSLITPLPSRDKVMKNKTNKWRLGKLRAHLQVLLWKAADRPDPPAMDITSLDGTRTS
ncbi:hypothetical protein AAFF_G00223040 [Aldrovandia affinis]|uniref:Uncharacterized protein n=1 Tax=Aldrovandia affinis TaxID=143900 RepID=A0AAD7W544_9TELE|nr:hypothetical protein AAFF_G00223040 [Aldrovandia affinis]